MSDLYIMVCTRLRALHESELVDSGSIADLYTEAFCYRNDEVHMLRMANDLHHWMRYLNIWKPGVEGLRNA